MPIIKLVLPIAAHICDPPDNPEYLYGVGTIWQCDVCKLKAELVHDNRYGFTWEWLVLQSKVK